MTRKEANRIVSAVNEGFSDELKLAFENHFPDVEIETIYNLLGCCLHTVRKDAKDFEPEQVCFIAAFEVGFMAARALLTKALDGV